MFYQILLQMMLLTLSEILRPPASLDKPDEVTAVSYMDWHCRLLTEDLLGPLRRDVTKLDSCTDVTKLDSSTDSLMHCGTVDIVHSSRVENVMKIRLRRNLNLETSNRLLPGTLVVLTDKSRKQKPIFGIISDCKTEEYKLILTVECSDIENMDINEEYVLYAYTVYYEAYIHSINNLKRYRDLPFSDLITGSILTVEKSNLFKNSKLKLAPTNYFHQKVPTVSDVSMTYKTLMSPKENPTENNSTVIDLDDELDHENLEMFDSSQKFAIHEALSKEMSLIQGPPGTGKSFVGSEIVKILLNNSESFSSKYSLPILVICYTNSALDQFLQLLLKFTKRIVRIGSRSQSESLEHHKLSAIRTYRAQNMLRKQSNYEQEKDLRGKINSLKNSVSLSEADRTSLESLTDELGRLQCAEDSGLCRRSDVLALTVTGAAKHRQLLELVRPRIVLVEEAAEILESHLVAALPSSTRHLIMIGDHRQLRPVTANYELLQRQPEFGLSLFERLVVRGVPAVMLSTQHRMAPEIARLVSSVYPDLLNHHSVKGRPLLPGINKRLLFLTHNISEDSGEDRSKSNQHEAEMVVGLAGLLVTLGVPAEEIVILAAYLGQLRLIRRLLERSGLKVAADSVDNYQGEESEVVLLSLVRSGAGTIGFLGQENRATVALTRARRGLVVLGDMDQLCQQSQMWRSVRDCLTHGECLVESLRLSCHSHGVTTEISSAQDFSLSPLGGCQSPCGETLSCSHTCRLPCHPPVMRHQCGAPCEKMCPNNLHQCRRACDELCGLCEERREISLPCGHSVTALCWVREDQVSCTERTSLQLSCGHTAELSCGQDPASVLCSVPCQHLMDCGHLCLLPCHTDLHHQPRCPQPCRRRARLCRADHTCPGLCHEDCRPCEVTVSRRLDCGHQLALQCHEDPDLHECTEKCPLSLDCGHRCRSLCHEPCGPCKVWLESLRLPCGHEVSGVCGQPPVYTKLVASGQSSSCRHVAMVPCHLSGGEEAGEAVVSPPCSEVCGVDLPCGHSCTGRCSDCSLGLHASCEAPCSRRLVCGHHCEGRCGALCPPCNKVTSHDLYDNC